MRSSFLLFLVLLLFAHHFYFSGSALQVAWHTLNIAEGALAALLWHDPHITAIAVVVIVLVGIVSWPVLVALRLLGLCLWWLCDRLWPYVHALVGLCGVAALLVVPLQRVLRSKRVNARAYAAIIAAKSGLADLRLSRAEDADDDDDGSGASAGAGASDGRRVMAASLSRDAPEEVKSSVQDAVEAVPNLTLRTPHDGSAISHISSPVVLLTIHGRGFPDVREAFTAEQRKKRKQIEALGGNADGAIGSTDTFLVIRRVKVKATGRDSELPDGDGDGDEGTEDTGTVPFATLEPSPLSPGGSAAVSLKTAREMEGALLKRSSNRLLSSQKLWKTRYFVVAGEYLLYYKSRVEAKGDAVARGAIDLHGVAFDELTGRPSITLESAEAGGALCVVTIVLHTLTADNHASEESHANHGSGQEQGDDVLRLKAHSEREASRWRGALLAVVVSLGASRGPPCPG